LLEFPSMDELPELSSLQVIESLWRLGFSIADANHDWVALIRKGRRVFVRRHSMLTPPALRVILFSAGLEARELLGALKRHEPPEAAASVSGVRPPSSSLLV